mgnify:CR=1 FL=1|tara:strand:+ start:5758 stop:6705 length:948 start_codon:yes stop_codon:yes gene_type:complete
MNRKPIIISIKGIKLKTLEKKIIKKYKPWGIILFKRNIKSFKQLKELTKEIRKCIKDPFYPILIDEEGGSVSRFNSLFNNKEFSQRFFGKIYENDKAKGKLIYKYYLNSICSILRSTGININTIPVLDLLQKRTHKIIQDRCYSNNIKTIKNLGNICIKTLKLNKIASVSKHIPGHGCANKDSHKKLPVVKDKLSKLYRNDFNLFNKLESNFVMTAHILYKNIDNKFPATLSERIIKKIIRTKLKFKGLIISDDIEMKALSKNLIFNANLALSSGCNLVLYCGGNTKKSTKLLKELNTIDSFTVKKTRQLYRYLR